MTECDGRDQRQAGQGIGAGQSPVGDPSRRAFVLGGAAIGMAGIVGGRRVARLSVRERGIEAAAAPSVLRVGNKAAVGASVSPGNPGGTTRLEAAQIFDQNMGGRKMAMAVERFYWPAGDWTIGADAQLMIQNGVAMVASFTPSQDIALSGPTEKANIISALSALSSLNATVHAVCLTHEPNNGKFGSGDEYQKYISYYGPTVIDQGFNLAYIPLVTRNQDIEAYYPIGTYNGQPLITHMYGDFYCSSFDAKPVGANLVEFFSVATSNGTSQVGLGEFGKTTSINNEPADSEFDTYCSYLINEFQAWNNAGNNSATITYFTNGTANNPSMANYASLERLWDALSTNA